jgi:Gas vesicle synthesis protein GvpL/GvpF
VTVLLYAITDLERASGVGVGGTALKLVRGSGLAAVISSRPELDLRDVAWEYERVVESLMASGTVLPARFGTTLEHEHAVSRFLASRRGQLIRGLERVRGAVEMAVRVQWGERDEPAADVDAAGTVYMLGRLARFRTARAIADRLAPLQTVARLGRVALMPRRGVAVLGAYLVDRGRADEFARWCDRLGDEISHAEFVCTGPWPPYSFATEDAPR